MLVDSHCHLDFPGLADNLAEVFAAMRRVSFGVA
jgi:Tat protein secretion system quality control protein TatD with DNase activity